MLPDLCTTSLVNISVEELVIGVWDGVWDDVEIHKLAEALIKVLTSEVVGIDMLVGEGVIVMVPLAVIDLEFAVSVSYDIDVLLDVLSDLDSDDMVFVTASDIDVDMLDDVDANVLRAVMAALKSVVSSPSADSASFC